MANRVGPHDLEQGHLILISDGNRLVDFNLENDGLCFGIYKLIVALLSCGEWILGGQEWKQEGTKLLF